MQETVSGLWWKVGYSHLSHEPICTAGYPECTWPVGIPNLYTDAPIQVLTPSNQRQCLIPHWQSYSYQAIGLCSGLTETPSYQPQTVRKHRIYKGDHNGANSGLQRKYEYCAICVDGWPFIMEIIRVLCYMCGWLAFIMEIWWGEKMYSHACNHP